MQRKSNPQPISKEQDVAKVSTARGGNSVPLVEGVVLVVVGAADGNIVDEEQSWRELEDGRSGGVVLEDWDEQMCWESAWV